MKLYVQLRPNAEGMEQLRAVQQSLRLEGQGKLVNALAIHLTILHIGAVDRLLVSMDGLTTIDHAEIIQRVHVLAAELEKAAAAVANTQYTLEPTGYDHFGEQGSTYALVFQPTSELTALHMQSLSIFKAFFASCGVTDTEAFMAADSNLRYAMSLRPHVTIAKNYSTRIVPHIALRPMTFTVMPIA